MCALLPFQPDFSEEMSHVHERVSDALICVLLSCAVLSHFSHVWPFVASWTITCQAPLSLGFSRRECWSGLPFPPPGDLPNPRIEPASFMSPALAGKFFTTSTTWEAPCSLHCGLQPSALQAWQPGLWEATGPLKRALELESGLGLHPSSASSQVWAKIMLPPWGSVSSSVK